MKTETNIVNRENGDMKEKVTEIEGLGRTKAKILEESKKEVVVEIRSQKVR